MQFNCDISIQKRNKEAVVIFFVLININKLITLQNESRLWEIFQKAIVNIEKSSRWKFLQLTREIEDKGALCCQ